MASESEREVPIESVNNASLTVSVIRTGEELDNIEEQWNHLAAKTNCTVFQTFQWTKTWLEHFGKCRELHCLVIRDNTEVVSIVPMIREKIKFLGIRIVTFLRFPFAKPAFYSDIMVLRGYEDRVFRALGIHLGSVRNLWNVFEVQEIKEDCAILKSLPSYLEESGVNVLKYQTGICSEVPLPPTWEEFLTYIGGKPRHEFKRKTDRLNEKFKVETDIIENGEKEVSDAVREIAAIHGKRWESLGYRNRYADKNELSFLIRAAQRFSAMGWLRVMFMKIDGERVAGLLNFNFGHHVYCYHANAVGSPEIMKYSPGILLHYSAIKSGIAEGFRGYDMMIGQENYKFTDVKSVQSNVWRIRGIAPGRINRLRFRAYTIFEMVRKGRLRIVDEYHITKRYYVTSKPSLSAMWKYLGTRVKALWEYERKHFFKSIAGEGTTDKEK